MQLSQKKVLITGGSAGIGLALVNQCIEAGSHVVICARNLRRLEGIARSNPTQIDIFQADLGVSSDLRRLVAEVTAKHADLAVLINNAGVQQHVDFFSDTPDRSPDLIANEMAVNFNAAAQLCYALIPILRTQKESAIINISSGLGLVPKKIGASLLRIQGSHPEFHKSASLSGGRRWDQYVDHRCHNGAGRYGNDGR